MELIIMNDGVYTLVQVTKEMLSQIKIVADVDCFLGSGSTLIACEKLKRICYGMELDPKYCDVIIKRWENFTGKKAELENGQN